MPSRRSSSTKTLRGLMIPLATQARRGLPSLTLEAIIDDQALVLLYLHNVRHM